MRKPEKSRKRRVAAAKRALKRNRRNTNAFKSREATKRLIEKKRKKIADEKKFKQHLANLFGK